MGGTDKLMCLTVPQLFRREFFVVKGIEVISTDEANDTLKKSSDK